MLFTTHRLLRADLDLNIGIGLKHALQRLHPTNSHSIHSQALAAHAISTKESELLMENLYRPQECDGCFVWARVICDATRAVPHQVDYGGLPWRTIRYQGGYGGSDLANTYCI